MKIFGLETSFIEIEQFPPGVDIFLCSPEKPKEDELFEIIERSFLNRITHRASLVANVDEFDGITLLKESVIAKTFVGKVWYDNTHNQGEFTHPLPNKLVIAVLGQPPEVEIFVRGSMYALRFSEGDYEFLMQIKKP